MLNNPSKQKVAFKIVKFCQMNETNLSEIDFADQNQDKYKYFCFLRVLLSILATLGIVGKFWN